MNQQQDAKEYVMAVEVRHIRDHGYFTGFSRDLELFDSIINLSEFKDRDKLETDENYKQIIPYVISVFDHPNYNNPLIFTYSRSEAGGEERLHGRRSIGIGGHVNTDDYYEARASLKSHEFCGRIDYYLAGLKRELFEEVSLKGAEGRHWKMQALGMVNQDDDDVGKVHIGMVHLVETVSEIAPLDEALHDPKYKSIGELTSEIGEYERWSQILIEGIAENIL